MDPKICAIPSCKKFKAIGRFCIRHYGDKFWMKIRCCLEEIYQNQPNLKDHLTQVLPDPVTLKDFSTFLNFLRIGYNLQDLRIIFQVFTGKNNCIVPRSLIISLILMPNTNWDVEDQPIVIPKVLNKAPRSMKVLDPRPLSPYSSYKAQISEKLQKNFQTFKEAFQKFSRSKTLGFFEFTRMLTFLSIPCAERTVKAFFKKFCVSSEMSELQFKQLWFGKNSLCRKFECTFEAGMFGLCKSHERLMFRKGEVILTEIESSLDKRSILELREILTNAGMMSQKNVKTLFSPFCRVLKDQDWESVMIFVNYNNLLMKEEESILYKRTFSSFNLERAKTSQ